VLSGGAFRVVREEASLEKFLADAVEVSGDKPVVVTKFVEGCKYLHSYPRKVILIMKYKYLTPLPCLFFAGAMEVEIDAVANKGEVVAYAISEHIEPAGVHSGDAHMVLPAPRLSAADQSRILDVSYRIFFFFKFFNFFLFFYFVHM
jgi:carbamoyl-phosphate synthase large subunit